MSFDSSASSGDNSSDIDISSSRALIYDDIGSAPRTHLDLHTSCAVGHYDHVRRFVINQSNVNLKNKGGWTPLMYASYVGHDNIVNFLLENNAKVDQTDDKGATALMLAASCGNESVAYFLVKRGAIVDERDLSGHTALFHATRQGHQNVVKLLVDEGADIEAGEPDTGFTPLMEAAKEGHELIVNTLLSSGANVTKMTTQGDTSKSLALQYGHMIIVSLIDNFLYRGRHSSLRSEADLEGSGDTSTEDDDALSQPDEPLGVRQYLPRLPDADIRSGPTAFASMWNRVHQDTGSTKMKRSHQRQLSNHHLAPPALGSKPASSSAQGELNFNYPIVPQERSRQNLADLASSNSSLSMYSSTESASAQSSDTDVSSVGQLANENGQDVDYEEDDRNTFSFPARDKSFSRKSEHHYRMKKQREVRKMRRLSDEKRKTEEEKVAAAVDLTTLLADIKLEKYAEVLEKEEIDLRTLLTMTEDDLKEVGLSLFGPRRKIMMAIKRINDQAASYSSKMEQAYADKLEVEKQGLDIKLQQALKQVEDLHVLLSQERELREMCESVSVEERLEKDKYLKKLRQIQDGVRAVVENDEGDQKLCSSLPDLLSDLDTYLK